MTHTIEYCVINLDKLSCRKNHLKINNQYLLCCVKFSNIRTYYINVFSLLELSLSGLDHRSLCIFIERCKNRYPFVYGTNIYCLIKCYIFLINKRLNVYMICFNFNGMLICTL